MLGDQSDSALGSENRLKELKSKYQTEFATLKKLEKEKIIKSNQLENSQNLLKEIQGNLLEKNQEIKKLKIALEESISQKQHKVKDFIKGRDMKDLDKKLEEKLTELAKKRAPLLPSKPIPIKDLKDKEELIMKIHTVKILYLKGVKDGEVTKKDRSYALELTVRLSDKTKFIDLKKLACEYWDLEEGIYSLRAYNYALIEYIDENVETFIKDQRMRPEFWLLEKNINAFKCLTEPGDYYTEDSSKNQNKNKESNKNQVDLEGRKVNYKKFLAHFEGARYIMPDVPLVDENHEANRLESWELNIFTCLVTLMLFILTVVIHYILGDFSNRYWISYQMMQSFENSMANAGLTYDTISSLTDVMTFMQGPLLSVYFDNPTHSNSYVEQYVPVGKMMVRFLETKERDCTYEVLGINNPQCYYDQYTSDTRNELGNGDDKIFNTSSQNGINSIITGEFTNYDGSGFSWSYFNYESSDYLNYVAQNEDLYNNNLRAIIISFTHYSPTYDYWVFTQVLIEISVYGSIFTHKVYPRVFKANLYAKPYEYFLALFFLRAFLSLYFLFYYFYFSLKKNKLNVRNTSYMYSIGGIYDLVLVLLSFVALGFAFSVKSDENSDLASNNFIDYTLDSDNFDYALIINAWAALPICVRFFNCLTINRNMYIVKLNIELAIKGILSYLILVISIFVAFMFIAWTVWGPYYIFYRQLSMTLVHNILFSIGIGNTALLIKINLFWTILYYILYLNFAIFILVCGFVGIYMEAYRQIKMSHGYQDDVKVWAFVDYVVWFLGCMNQKRLRQKIEEFIQKRKQKEEERNKKEAEKKLFEQEKKDKEKRRNQDEDEEEEEEEKSEKDNTDRD